MERWYKRDFEIKGRRTGTRIRGSAEYVYEIYWNGKLLSDRSWTSKAKADAWLGQFLQRANKIRLLAEKNKKSLKKRVDITIETQYNADRW